MLNEVSFQNMESPHIRRVTSHESIFQSSPPTSFAEEIMESPHIRRVTSYGSFFQSSPPTTFAEEVAEALCRRARDIGNSHPSVFIGKQRRLMEGLMNAAEVIRKDLGKMEKDLASAPSRPNISLTNIEDDELKLSNPFLQRLSDIDQKKKRVNDRTELEDMSWLQNDIPPEGDTAFSFPSMTQKPANRKKSRFSIALTNNILINFFQCRLNKKPKSEKKRKLRDRILAFVNNDRMRNFRTNVRCVWSATRKSAATKFTNMKTSIFTTFKE